MTNRRGRASGKISRAKLLGAGALTSRSGGINEVYIHYICHRYIGCRVTVVNEEIKQPREIEAQEWLWDDGTTLSINERQLRGPTAIIRQDSTAKFG